MCDKTNLWEETIADLEENGKKWEDVEFVCTDDYVLVNFEKEAKEIYYDSGYGGAEIPMNLKVVGSDFWMERHEYDGSEWWEYKTMPKKPKWCADAKPVLHCLDPVVVMQTEQHWIPCEEQLPREMELVLCQCEEGIIDVLRLKSNGFWEKHPYPYVNYSADFVIAWMPLPKPYKEVEE